MKTKIEIVKCNYATLKSEKHNVVLFSYVVTKNYKPLFVISAHKSGKLIPFSAIRSISYEINGTHIIIEK